MTARALKALFAAAVLCGLAGCGGDSEKSEVKAPKKVKVAHIMLEKEEIPDELDADSARRLVQKRKLRERTLEIEREEIKKAMAKEDFEAAFRITLLKQRKQKK